MRRPKMAPIAIEGTKMPAGPLQPYETITKTVRMMIAVISEKITKGRREVSQTVSSKLCSHSLKRVCILSVISRRRKILK